MFANMTQVGVISWPSRDGCRVGGSMFRPVNGWCVYVLAGFRQTRYASPSRKILPTVVTAGIDREFWDRRGWWRRGGLIRLAWACRSSLPQVHHVINGTQLEVAEDVSAPKESESWFCLEGVRLAQHTLHRTGLVGQESKHCLYHGRTVLTVNQGKCPSPSAPPTPATYMSVNHTP